MNIDATVREYSIELSNRSEIILKINDDTKVTIKNIDGIIRVIKFDKRECDSLGKGIEWAPTNSQI